LYNNDCLKILPTLPDHSVDMVLSDLPFGSTRNQWDSIIPMDQLWEQYKRLLKVGGVVALFGDEPFSV
jgi:site-specific DNA-methyltransferase (adenine-specific)